MSLDLQTADDKGNLPKRRIMNAKSAFAIYEQMHQADADASYNRSIVRRWTDGEPPLDQADLEDAGMGWTSNFNSLRASADSEQATSNFVNLADSVPHLCTFSTTHGKPEERKPWLDAMQEEYDWLLKKRWSSFYDNKQKTADAYMKDALAVCYWPDDVDWRFEVGKLGQFLFAADADVDESKQDIVLFVEDYSFRQLVELLDKDKKVRESEDKDKSHINREAVIAAIKDSAKDTDIVQYNAEEIVQRVEENAFYYDYAKNQKIKLVHYFVQEASGRVTHSIGRADGKNQEYLSDRYEAYPSMQEVFVFYADGIGSWKLSSLKGMIRKALPLYMSSDEVLNKAKDHLILNLMKWLQSKSSSGKALLSQLTLGPLSIMPPEIEFVDAPLSSEAGTQVFPLMSQFDRLTANNTGGYQSHAVSPEGGNRTATEVTTQAASTAQLSSAKLGNYYQSEAKLHQNIINRLINPNYLSTDKGYAERMEWMSRMVMRGVPMQAIWKIDEVKPVRAIGYGSFVQQQAAFQTLQAQSPLMDQVGQQNLARDIAATAVGYDNVSRYFTQDTPRTPEGTREALNEHDTFRNGSARPVFADDPHIVHAVTHNQFLSETISMLHQGQMDTPSALKQMAPALQHQRQHLQLATKDPSREDVLEELFKQFGQFSTMFEKLQQQGEQQPQSAPQQDPKMLMEQQKAQADIARQDALAQAEIQRENAKTDNHIQNQNIKTGAHIQTNALKTASSVIPNSVEAIQPPQFPNQP